MLPLLEIPTTQPAPQWLGTVLALLGAVGLVLTVLITVIVPRAFRLIRLVRTELRTLGSATASAALSTREELHTMRGDTKAAKDTADEAKGKAESARDLAIGADKAATIAGERIKNVNASLATVATLAQPAANAPALVDVAQALQSANTPEKTCDTPPPGAPPLP